MRLKHRKMYRIAAFYKWVGKLSMCAFGLVQFNQEHGRYVQPSLSNTLKNVYFYPYGINALINHSSISA